MTEQGGLIGQSRGPFTHQIQSRNAEKLADISDNIESNVTSVARDTSSAAEELTTAHEYQRKAGRRMACLLIILVVVVLVILLAVSRAPLMLFPADIQILS